MKREANSNARRRQPEFKTNYYVDGNTVRRLEGEPEERRRKQLEKERKERQKKNRRVARRNQEKALRMSMGYVSFCTMAVLISCVVCVTYIQLQSDITSRMKHISTLESQITDLKADNDAAIKRIDLSTDLEDVKYKAIHELGMKYAGPGQIVYYTVEDSDYMNQYSDIP
ncbi:MAG: hypothetical protein HFI77_04190 [Lachnospiraceae bacterium]|jgi:hypothetical protein|uniref:hypothetical protein n=1 Tax=Roseburia sp. 1XD42-69 TaxID=2320088 RepID=UPI000EA15C9D|nr:hypothetical protein [Roseburia sp. 1XD42-69]MCI8875248.1 hypothetical protein [Lachnospiraceae bacterium]MCX4319842.1 hypothetical protein [Lachnospiraceae bacterium]RKJ68240.1 hypothetical protein D7Y06_02485 [Roseburia sp. 1XD42-69]